MEYDEMNEKREEGSKKKYVRRRGAEWGVHNCMKIYVNATLD